MRPVIILFFAAMFISAGREFPRTPTTNQYMEPLGEWEVTDNEWQTTFKVPFEWADRRPFLHISQAGRGYEVTVNGEVVGENRSGMTSAEFDLTGYANEGVNELVVRMLTPDVLTPEREPFLGESYIVAQPPVRIRDYVVSPLSDAVELGVIVKSHLLNPKTVRVYYAFTSLDGSDGPYGHRDANFEMKLEDTVRFYVPMPSPLLWSHEMPHLYRLKLRVQYEGRFTEDVEYRVGLRKFGVEKGVFFVNGRPVVLTEENTLHLHEPATDSVYRAADSLGLYVLGTADINTSRWGTLRTVGGNPSNDPQWENDYVDRALSVYYTTRTHPSAAIFAIAENSANGYNLYESYLALKAVEPSRPIIYPEGGEWNSDTLRFGETASRRPHFEISHVRDTVIVDGKRELHASVFVITNRFETATHRDVVLDWSAGRLRGSMTLNGTLEPDQRHEFMVDYGTRKPSGETTFRLFRPWEPFDKPLSKKDKRKLVELEVAN